MAEAAPNFPEMFGKYELLAKVATGGMAEIFRASSSSIGGFEKILALKRMLPRLSTDAEFVSLFIAEAKLAVALNHSNIVQVLDFGRVDQSHYIAMEFVEGKDLTHLLIKLSRQKRLVPIEVACHIIAAAARALEYAHTRRGRDGAALGIVHRDVSPHNILVSYSGEVKLADFGIAKAKNHVTLTSPGLVLGKFAYMSPEQARGEGIDHRTDIYATGITLYETLTGRRLFYSEDPAQTLAKVRNPKIPLPSRYNDQIPPELDAVVMRALAVDPKERYQSARELSTALSTLLARRRPDFTDFEMGQFMTDLFPDEVHALLEGDPRPTASVPEPAPRSSPRPSTVPGRVPPRSASAASGPIAPARPRDAEAKVRAALERLSTTPSGKVDPLEAETLVPGKLDVGKTPDATIDSITGRLLAEPNLWLLTELGQRFLQLGQRDDAVRALRVAALKFAQSGLLVQALAIEVELLALAERRAPILREISELPGLAGRPNEEVLALAKPDATDPLGRLLEQIIVAAEPSRVAEMMTAPLFGALSPEELARFAGLLRLRRVPPATPIVQEGQRGQSLYLIARGRVIIYCRNFQSERVYLSSLTDGDCFGEFSFFTGEPRAATVEAADEVTLFEIAQEDFDRVIDEFPGLTRALVRLYKERVVATLLAKSELFGVLPARARAALLERLEPEQLPRDAVILREGERSEAFYLVKSGEVEVYSERFGYVLLSKLRAGDFFGEIAAITGQPRTASVRTLTPVELLRLSAHQLRALLSQNDEMAKILERRIKQREAETALRLTAGGALI